MTWCWFKFPPVVWEGGVFPLCFKGVTMNQTAFKEKEKKKKQLMSYALFFWQGVKSLWEETSDSKKSVQGCV